MPKPPNPALKAMGLSWIKFPSRNWLIFGSVFTISISGVLYDKEIQKKIRSKYIDEVKDKSYAKITTTEVPRKITVFIAPPPSDYLDSSLKIWRRYIKPILYYSGYDYELVEEHRQGVIRTEVANRIRTTRKQMIEQSNDPATEGASVNPLEETDGKEYKRSFDYRNLMGIFYKKEKPTEIISEDAQVISPELAGGVICIGRGAYKEYINGIHEGMLGPLEAPKIEEENNSQNDVLAKDVIALPEVIKPKNTNESQELNPVLSSEDTKSETKDEFKDSLDEEEKAELKKLKPFIKPEDYSAAEIPLEISQALLKNNNVLKSPDTNIPILLHQPVLVIPVPNLIGFLAIPERIYRFYTKRYYVEKISSDVADLINQKNIRPYNSPDDLSLAKEEELDWPKKWVKQGLERKSEWTRELLDDQRVVQHMNVCSKPSTTSESPNSAE